MDWQERITAALAYIETQLAGELDAEAIAARANCSAFHFMRMFEVVSGVGLGEYLRRRRLSRAAADLAAGDARVVEVALRYRYESPDAFARAFKREFGLLPSEARRPGARLHGYPPLAFSIALVGDRPMEYRIEKAPAYRMTGIGRPVGLAGGSNFLTVPRFWDETMADGRCDALFRAARASGSALGVAGVCRDSQGPGGDFVYSIAVEAPADRSGLPADCADFTVPASTWAKFTSRGPLRPNFQATIKRIYAEWFPASGREHAGTAEIEFYPPLADPESPDYWCEYWVPVR